MLKNSGGFDATGTNGLCMALLAIGMRHCINPSTKLQKILRPKLEPQMGVDYLYQQKW